MISTFNALARSCDQVGASSQVHEALIQHAQLHAVLPLTISGRASQGHGSSQQEAPTKTILNFTPWSPWCTCGALLTRIQSRSQKKTHSKSSASKLVRELESGCCEPGTLQKNSLFVFLQNVAAHALTSQCLVRHASTSPHKQVWWMVVVVFEFR